MPVFNTYLITFQKVKQAVILYRFYQEHFYTNNFSSFIEDIEQDPYLETNNQSMGHVLYSSVEPIGYTFTNIVSLQSSIVS